jgi:hypothetical protein
MVRLASIIFQSSLNQVNVTNQLLVLWFYFFPVHCAFLFIAQCRAVVWASSLNYNVEGISLTFQIQTHNDQYSNQFKY